MTGLVYKELRQNRINLWAAALAAPGFLLLMLAFSAVQSIAGNANFADLYAELAGKNDLPFSMLQFYTVFGPFFVGGLVSLTIFTQDETKKWGYFTASHPKGIRGAVYAKYLIVFLVSVIVLFSVNITDMILLLLEHLILGTAREDLVSYTDVYAIVLFIQLFLRMFDIPFIIRFGRKRGEKVKVAIFGFGFIAFLVYLLFGPLPGKDAEIFVSVYDWYQNFISGKAQEVSYCILAGFLWLTIIGYNISYRISCKLYMKGVEQYDK
ncbi:MAG: ABC-2 transporter permease [Oscillospiraceae bacterium]|nr:ABC-2 transporter permease [Oscillospiraceae bacterium]